MSSSPWAEKLLRSLSMTRSFPVLLTSFKAKLSSNAFCKGGEQASGESWMKFNPNARSSENLIDYVTTASKVESKLQCPFERLRQKLDSGAAG